MPTPSTRTSAPRIPAASGGTAALARCLEPVAREEFVRDHWERRPLVVTREGRAGFEDLLSRGDVERLVESSGLRHPAFRLVKAGEKLELGDYTVDIPWRPSSFSRTADPGRIGAAFAEGATIVVQGLHHWWHPLAVFCRALEADLGEPVQVNAYYTPRDSQGLPVHHDTHDVFVLQVAGEKRWLVYEPAWELPLKEQRYDEEMGAPGDPVHDVTLRPGDTLYLPRGWLHEALTSASDSLHLTVGVNVYTWLDAVRAALSACEEDVRFRRSVGADAEGGSELLDALAAALAPEAVARRRRDRLVSTRRPILDGQIAEERTLRRLAVDTPLERRATVIAERSDAGGGTVALAYEGKTLVFPPQARAELDAIVAAAGPFRARDLPGELDEAGRLVLLRRLVREGFLRRASRPGPGDPSPRDGAGAGDGATST